MYWGLLKHIVLQVIYKLVSSVLASCLLFVLSQILDSHQKAYVPERNISKKTCNTYDLIYHEKKNNNSGIGLLVDLEKAFSSVSFYFIFTSSNFFNFGSFLPVGSISFLVIPLLEIFKESLWSIDTVPSNSQSREDAGKATQ